jgi:hypothetical protein
MLQALQHDVLLYFCDGTNIGHRAATLFLHTMVHLDYCSFTACLAAQSLAGPWRLAEAACLQCCT